ncbi:MAG: hypothetical protein HKP27_16655 [Myxococcales bacterium]|nr:hypothetical protein [Myxococcales bacterium]
MSTILKALDRVEERKGAKIERDPLRDDVPLASHVETIPASMAPTRGASRTRPWVWALVALAVLAVGWGSFAAFRAFPGGGRAVPAEVTERAPAANAGAPEPTAFDRGRATENAAPELPAVSADAAPLSPPAATDFAPLPPPASSVDFAPLPPPASADFAPLPPPVYEEVPASAGPGGNAEAAPAIVAHEVVPEPGRSAALPAVSARPPVRAPEPEFATPKPETAVVIPPPPDVAVLKTAWHPDAARRSARIEVQGFPEALNLREGDAVGTLVVVSIEPSAVVFLHGGREVRHGVGGASR